MQAIAVVQAARDQRYFFSSLCVRAIDNCPWGQSVLMSGRLGAALAIAANPAHQDAHIAHAHAGTTQLDAPLCCMAGANTPVKTSRVRRFVLAVADGLSAHSATAMDVLNTSAAQPKAVVLGAVGNLPSADPARAHLLVGLAVLAQRSMKAASRVGVPQPINPGVPAAADAAAVTLAELHDNFVKRMQVSWGCIRLCVKVHVNVQMHAGVPVAALQ